ncbi:MAG: hypothetical protein QOH37_1316 [Nocardioidaceae bacterium]|nr:hypothetical protein [Nocardioidaceae bacterium]
MTLLFTDVSGSTAMGEQLDPEAYRGVMGRYFDVARAAIERHGGTVEKFVGDAVLAVFGVPDVHEDDALRAVRAAHELNAEVLELADALRSELGVQLAIRTGVNTGTVVTGSARAGGSFATGDAVNTAARLEQAAGPGEILLGAATYQMVRDAVEAEPVDPVPAKGKAEAVPAYRLRRVLDAVHGHRRREDVPLVGRAHESRALDDALERTLTSGRNHLVTVLGPPGIGKSRLVGDFLIRVDDRASVAKGRCVAYGQGITYWPLVQALRQALRLSGTESDEITRHALEQALGSSRDRDEVADALLPLFGKSGTPSGSEETFWSVCRLLEELATRRPLVLSIDDLHWAEPSLLDLLARLHDEVADLPILLLCQARPELLEQHPGWGTGRLNAMTFGLDPLGSEEIGSSVAALLDGVPPEGLADTVAAWSGGNPLFVEEIVAHLVESGALADDGSSWRLVGALDQAQLPPNVSALLASRLDRLPPEERDLLERVSVIGLQLTVADAELMVEPGTVPEVGRLLASLTRREVLRRVRTPYHDSWAFKHVLVRDAAYEGLAKSLRADLHERFADGLVMGVEAGGEQSGLVAHHLEQAARHRREVAVGGPRVDALVERAVGSLVTAGAEARDQDHFETCVAYLERAAALHPATAQLRRVLERLCFVLYETRQFQRLRPALSALADLEETADSRARMFAATIASALDMFTSDTDPAATALLARQLTALGHRDGDTRAVVDGLRVLSDCALVAALWDDATTNGDEIIRIGSPADARAARKMRGVALMYGDTPLHEVSAFMHERGFREDTSALQEMRALMIGSVVAAADVTPDAAHVLAANADRIRDLHAEGKVPDANLSMMVTVSDMNHDLDGAISYAQEVNDGFRRAGDTGFASTTILQQAMLMLRRGDPSEAVLPLVEEGSSYTSPYDALSVAFEAGCRALLALRDGDQPSADALAEEALRVIDRTQQVWQGADLRRWLAPVPRAAGDAPLERRMLREAAARYERKEIRSYDVEIQARLAELGDAAALPPA